MNPPQRSMQQPAQAQAKDCNNVTTITYIIHFTVSLLL